MNNIEEILSRAQGMLVGSVAGRWTADTSMMLCLIDSLIACAGNNAQDQMQRYLDLYEESKNSPAVSALPFSNSIVAALHKFKTTGNPMSGSMDEYSSENGSLLRIAPIALYFQHCEENSAMTEAAMASQTTHAEIRCIQACELMTLILHRLINNKLGQDKGDFLRQICQDYSNYRRLLHPNIRTLLSLQFLNKPLSNIRSGEMAIPTLETALWGFYHADNFQQGADMLLGLGHEANGAAILYGQLAGAFYRLESIPARIRYSHDRSTEIESKTRILAQLIAT